MISFLCGRGDTSVRLVKKNHIFAITQEVLANIFLLQFFLQIRI